MELFGVTDHDVFICRSAVINGNLAELYFSEFVYAGGKWSSPCEIGSRKLSADQSVCRLWEDILWALLGYSTLDCTLLMGLASHGSNLQMAHCFKPASQITTSVSGTGKVVRDCTKICGVGRGAESSQCL